MDLIPTGRDYGLVSTAMARAEGSTSSPADGGKGHGDDKKACEDSPPLSFGFKMPHPPTNIC